MPLGRPADEEQLINVLYNIEVRLADIRETIQENDTSSILNEINNNVERIAKSLDTIGVIIGRKL